MTCEDRSRLAYADLVLRPSDGKGETKVLVATPRDDAYGQISPDGRWLLWASDDPGRYEVYVAPFPGGGSRVQVSREGGTQPRWNPAGSEILFKTPGNVLTAVRIETGSGTISVGTPTPLFPIVEFTGWTYALPRARAARRRRRLADHPSHRLDGDPDPTMTITPGLRLGPYEITAKLGEGGWERCTGPPQNPVVKLRRVTHGVS
jgi:hypothetical protein